MGLKEFKIIFDKPYASYIPGESVTGKVSLIIDSTKILRTIKIITKGAAHVHWSQTKGTGTDTIEFSDDEEYFKMELPVLEPKTGRWFRGEKTELPAGSYSYPFQFDLPSKLPSSFESELGYIRYTVKATLVRPWSFDQDTKAAFTVVVPFDLNQLPNSSESVMFEKSKKFCCRCSGSKLLTINALIPIKGFVPGQIIPLKVNVENLSGIVIKEVRMVLLKKITYTGDLSYSFVPIPPREGTKKIELPIIKVAEGPIAGKEFVSYEEKMEVPPLPPNLENCRIMSSEYEIKIKACVTGIHRKDLIARIPIYIGTTPILRYEVPQKSNFGTNPSFNQEIRAPSAQGAISQITPSTYEECTFSSKGIKDHDDLEETIGVNEDFAPMYPVFKFKSA